MIRPYPCPFPNCYASFYNPRGVAAHAGRKHKTIPAATKHHRRSLSNSNQLPRPLPNTDEAHAPGDYIHEVDMMQPPEEPDPLPTALFEKEQIWILNWMRKALVSQAMQSRFYKDMSDLRMNLTNLNIRNYADAERLIRSKLETIEFDCYSFAMFGQTFTMYSKDLPSLVTGLLKRKDLCNELSYSYNRLVNDNGDRIYSEITNSNHFKNIELLLPQGNTLIDIILAIDDTCLSSHSGNAKARPLYMTLGNLSNRSRRSLKYHAWTLVALLPIVESSGLTTHEKVAFNHKTLEIALKSLIAVEREGINIRCSDQVTRLCNLVPAQCVVDLLEAYNLAGVPHKTCPQCMIDKTQMNDLKINKFVRRKARQYQAEMRSALERDDLDIVNAIAEEHQIAPIWVNIVRALW